MPEACELIADVTCPACGATTDLPGGVVRFHWGRVPHTYRPGDAVRWLRGADGELVPPFRVIVERGRLGRRLHATYNFGDPACRSLYAFDDDPHEPDLACGSCGTEFVGVAAQVEDGVIVRAVAFTEATARERLGAPAPPAHIVVIREDGSPWPRPEWDDPPMSPLNPEAA